MEKTPFIITSKYYYTLDPYTGLLKANFEITNTETNETYMFSLEENSVCLKRCDNRLFNEVLNEFWQEKRSSIPFKDFVLNYAYELSKEMLETLSSTIPKHPNTNLFCCPFCYQPLIAFDSLYYCNNITCALGNADFAIYRFISLLTKATYNHNTFITSENIKKYIINKIIYQDYEYGLANYIDFTSLLKVIVSSPSALIEDELSKQIVNAILEGLANLDLLTIFQLGRIPNNVGLESIQQLVTTLQNDIALFRRIMNNNMFNVNWLNQNLIHDLSLSEFISHFFALNNQTITELEELKHVTIQLLGNQPSNYLESSLIH